MRNLIFLYSWLVFLLMIGCSISLPPMPTPEPPPSPIGKKCEDLRNSTVCAANFLPATCLAKTYKGGTLVLEPPISCMAGNSCYAAIELELALCKRGMDPQQVLDSDIQCSPTGTTEGPGCKTPGVPTLLGHYYPDACPSRLYPHGTDCSQPVNNLMEVPDPNYKTCEALGIRVGDPCRDGVDRCVSILPCARKENPNQIVLEANYMFCRFTIPDPHASFFCPESTASAKQNIHYLTHSDKNKVAREILDLKLANYEYRPGYPDSGEPFLGFIIEDTPNASFVLKKQRRVNLYSYISALVAAIQLQQDRIEMLESAHSSVRVK